LRKRLCCARGGTPPEAGDRRAGAQNFPAAARDTVAGGVEARAAGDRGVDDAAPGRRGIKVLGKRPYSACSERPVEAGGRGEDLPGPCR
jgi:hypothetical protein